MIRNSRRVVTLAVAGAVAITPVISGCGAGSEPQTAAPTQLTEGVNVTVPKDRPQAAQIDIRNMFLLGPKPDETFGPGSSLPLYATIINQVKGRQDRLVSVASPNFAQVRIADGAVVLPPAQPSGQGSAVRLIGQSAAPSASPTATTTGKPGKKKKPGATPEPTGTGATPNTPSTPEPGNTPSAPETSAPVTSAPVTSAPEPGSAAPGSPAGKAPLVVLIGLNRQVLGGERLLLRLQFEQAGTVDVTVPVIPQQGEYTAYTAVSAATPSPGASGSAQPSGTATPGTGH